MRHNVKNRGRGSTRIIRRGARELSGLTLYPGIAASASEDFAVVAERAPSAFMCLSAGFEDERGECPARSPKMRFSEDVCAVIHQQAPVVR